ncbi:MAG TPA: ATP-dependent Clp protease proteolytic subunit, partial [Trebonia sp.]|nr:ATP-dependent Clp protease proteolytic subunit [Trebonia sp.]
MDDAEATAGPPPDLPALPGFREMALRRMAAERSTLVRDLVALRQAAGLSQTEVAARMGTSQSAVARLEAGSTDVRATTLERYAAAVGTVIPWTPPARTSPSTVQPGGPTMTEQAENRGAGSRPWTDAGARGFSAGATASDPQSAAASLPGQPGEPGRPDIPGRPWDPGIPPGAPRVPGAPGFPGRPGAPLPGAPGPVPPTRVWADPHADWQDLLYARLLEKRIVMASGILDSDAATRLSAQLLTLDAEGGEPIRVEMQNLHADLQAVLAVMGVLDTLRAPVTGQVSGEIRGAAVGLLVACQRRLAYPSAVVALTEPRMELGGTVTAVTERQQQAERMLDSLYYRLAEVTGRTADQVRE